MTRGKKIGIAFSFTLLFIGIIWIFYNVTVANPAANKKLACLDEKQRLLDEAGIALDKGDSVTGNQLRLQADSIQGC